MLPRAVFGGSGFPVCSTTVLAFSFDYFAMVRQCSFVSVQQIKWLENVNHLTAARQIEIAAGCYGGLQVEFRKQFSGRIGQAFIDFNSACLKATGL